MLPTLTIWILESLTVTDIDGTAGSGESIRGSDVGIPTEIIIRHVQTFF